MTAVSHPYLRKQYAPLHQLFVKWSLNKQIPKELIICQVGTLFYRDCLDTLGETNADVFPFDCGLWKPEALQNMFANHTGSKVFSINLIDGLGELVADVNLDYICWEIDPATSPYQKVSEQAANHSRIYTYRKGNISLLKSAGYTNLSYLPLAANPKLRRPIEDDEIAEKYKCPVSFVGSSLKANADRLLNLIMRWVNQRKAAGDAGNWSGFQQLLNRMVTEFPNWRENTLDIIASNLKKLEIPLEENIEGSPLSLPMAIAEYRGYRKRLEVVRSVGEHFEIKVWGDDGWQGQCGQLGEYCGAADHEDELTAIYNGSVINLDIGRIYQPEIITMRVFDVMSTGSLVLTEDRESHREIFEEGKHCLYYREKEDLLETIEQLISNPAGCRKIGETAREEILNTHTIKQRMETMGLVNS